MATGKTQRNFTWKNYSITTGDSQYQGYYYGDASIADLISDYDPVSFAIMNVTSNRPAFVIRNGNTIRAYTTVSSTEVSVRVLWMKG